MSEKVVTKDQHMSEKVVAQAQKGKKIRERVCDVRTHGQRTTAAAPRPQHRPKAAAPPQGRHRTVTSQDSHITGWPPHGPLRRHARCGPRRYMHHTQTMQVRSPLRTGVAPNHCLHAAAAEDRGRRPCSSFLIVYGSCRWRAGPTVQTLRYRVPETPASQDTGLQAVPLQPWFDLAIHGTKEGALLP
jgi:hypothetical protein